MQPNEIYSEIIREIVELMETHGSGWTRAWATQGDGMHRNVVTDAPYPVINALPLDLTACQKAYDTPA